MKQLTFDRKRHRYAKLSDGTIEPLFYGDGTESRNFYKAEFGRWYLDFDRYYEDGIVAMMHLQITEFLEDKE